MRTVGLGIQEFEKIRKKDLFYIDKTDFIAQWYRKSDDITLLTRPRRFGKTLTIDMLSCFFSTKYAGREDLFAGLAVSRDDGMMALQGTVPVIKISFAGVKGESFMAFLVALAGRISMLLGTFGYLTESDTLSESEKKMFREMAEPVPDIPDPKQDAGEYIKYIFRLTHILHYLSFWLYRLHEKKVYIFMDEYDTPLQTAYTNHYYDDAIGIMRELFAETFKENTYLDRAVITGITRIAKESLFSDMNNLAACSVISGGYDTSFGFTQEEVDAVLKEYDIEDQRERVRFWYDGFTVGNARGLYNPWSILNYLSALPKPPEDYWAKSGGLGLIDHLVRRGSISLKEGFETLLGGGQIEREINEDLIFPMLDIDEESVWSLLIASGYARPEASPDEHDKTGICLTNYESKRSLSKMVKGWFRTRSGNYMTAFSDALLADDLWEMNDAMQKVVLSCASFFDSGIRPAEGSVQPENFFHALTLGMLTNLSGDFRVTSNRESGFGRYDVSVTPLDSKKQKFVAILEFKVFDAQKGDVTLEDTAKRARSQIDEKAYDTELIAGGNPVETIRRYGFGFRGKEVMIV